MDSKIISPPVSGGKKRGGASSLLDVTSTTDTKVSRKEAEKASKTPYVRPERWPELRKILIINGEPIPYYKLIHVRQL